MRKLTTAITTTVALAVIPAAANAATPFQNDSLGPIRDVTAEWQSYQPASAFCIKPDTPHYTPGGSGATATGSDPACRRSGFSRSATGLVKIQVLTPLLCTGCRRLFIDFSKIGSGSSFAHGHAYYRLASANFTYTIDPIDHSPNTKNFANDKLLAPSGSLQERVLGTLDLHQAFAYVTDTAHFVHTAIQGPYYIGPWYLNRAGKRVGGVYFDVDVGDATRFSSAQPNAIGYATGFDSGRFCPSDDPDLLYGGCLDAFSLSATTVPMQ